MAVDAHRLLDGALGAAARAVPRVHVSTVTYSTDKIGQARRSQGGRWEHRQVPAPSASAFVRACRREPVPHTPVWFMRQAGRSLPEYRKAREGVDMLESCLRPDLVVEITMQPVRRHGVDAAILFSDIVLPLKAAGFDLDIVGGVGPVIAEPVRSAADVQRVPTLEPDHVAPITTAIEGLVTELGDTPLIGYAGAPFTLASYLVEGGPSREHARTKALMYGDEETWHAAAPPPPGGGATHPP